MGEKLWTGTATVAQEVNRDVTTRLPMDEALEGLPAGIYALKAAVPGVDPYDVPAGLAVVRDFRPGRDHDVGRGRAACLRAQPGHGRGEAGVTVELLNRANAVLGTATTDDAGLCPL